mgnify:CR=1 FL=1
MRENRLVLALCSLLLGAQSVMAHVVLGEPAALAGTSHRAVFRVGHGCGGNPTTAIKVFMPAGFQGTKPMPKPGWALSIRKEKLDIPYDSHGKTVSEDVVEVTWTASSKENWLPDAWYDEFVLRGDLPAQAGPLWFRVLQSCENLSLDWSQIPAGSTSTKGLKAPALLLEVIPAGPVTHPH